MHKFVSSIIFASLLLTGCQTHNYAGRGAAVGGLTGGGIGAVIGELAGDEPLVGAVVGSAIGAFTGATVGSGLDEIDARNEARVQQAVYAQTAGGTSLQELVAMADSGLSDQVITRHIRTQGFNQPLDAADLIALRRQGVSDTVIGALQDTASRPNRLAQAQTAVIVEPPPVIVEESYLPIGPRHWRYHHGRPCPPYVRHPGVHWGVSFGH